MSKLTEVFAYPKPIKRERVCSDLFKGILRRELLELQKLEAAGLVKLSKLTKVSAYPKLIERQCSDLFKGVLRRE